MKRHNVLASAAIIAVAVAAVSGPAHAEPYKLGYVTDLSGPLAGSYTPTWQGFELYMKSVNEAGGINGNKVELVLDDDGLRADRAVAAAKKQMESDKVIGIFGLSLSSTHASVLAETRNAGVPVVTSFSAIMESLPPAKPYSYSAGVMFEVAGEAIGALSERIVKEGKVVGVTFDSVGGRSAIKHNQLSVEKAGYSWGEVLFPVRTADFTPFAQSVAAMNPAIVVGHYGAEQNLGMIAALRATGYKGPYVIAAYGASEDTARQAAQLAGSDENIYMVSRYAPSTADVPGMPALKEAAEKFGIDNPTSMHVTGWVLGAIAADALKRCGEKCDRDSLNAAVQKTDLNTQGLTGGPIRFTEDDHYGTSYWRLYKWDGEKLAPVGDWLEKSGLDFAGN